MKELKLDKTETWSFKHVGLYCKINHWGVERANDFEPMNNGQGIWNYYVWLREDKVKDNLFETELWLAPQFVSFGGPTRITYDYMKGRFADVDWHGGITFYGKHGQDVGYRNVELGCDYNHLYDSERGYNYTLEEVYEDCKRTAEQLAAIYLKQE